MNHTTNDDPIRLFDVASLYEALHRLRDTRSDKGKRYSLALVLLLTILGKLCGED